MTWAFLDDQANENEKLVEIGGAAAWYWACGLMYCRRKQDERERKQQRLDFIPAKASLTLYADTKAPKHIRELLRVGLWLEAEGGFTVPDYRSTRARRRWSRAFYRFVRTRDQNRCRYCGSEERITIDHVVPRIHGGDDGPDNLVCACLRCNLHKGPRTPAEAGMVLQ